MSSAPPQDGLRALASVPGTFPLLLQSVVANYGDQVLLVRRHARGGDPVTFRQLAEGVDLLAAGLLDLGIRRGDRVGLLADNRAEWLLADLACASIGAVDVPRGCDTTPGEMRFILGHAGCRMAFVDNDAIAKTLLAAAGELPELTVVCVMAPETQVEGVISMTELSQRGRRWLATHDLTPFHDAVQAQDLLTIVYTSGTTADPKGVMLTHHNVLSNIRAVNKVLDIGQTDLFLSVLPAWHMYERILDYVVLSFGASMVYTDRRRIKEDLAAVRPTAFAAVPRIWEMIHDGIVNHCSKLTGLRKRLLQHTLAICRCVGAGRASWWQRLQHQLLGRTVLPKLRAATGGRLRLAVSGGGSLPAHVDELLLGIGIPLLNGYGLTETSPVAAVRLPSRRDPYTIGPPLPDTEIEARDAVGVPVAAGKIGILWIRGPQVMRGYYRNERKTDEVLDAQGWFNSGDLGCIDSNGQIRITGRAKDTIVLGSGENVEPEPIETAIKTSIYIDQAVVVGQDQKSLGALVVPIFEQLEQAVPRAAWDVRDGQMFGKAVRDLIRRELQRLLTKDRGFRPLEQIASFAVLAEPMTQENGLLTPTLKIKRHLVHRQFAEVIRRLFGTDRDLGD